VADPAAQVAIANRLRALDLTVIIPKDPVAGTNPDSWTFGARASAIPDGGATVMLLGLALTGLTLLKRQLAA